MKPEYKNRCSRGDAECAEYCAHQAETETCGCAVPQLFKVFRSFKIFSAFSAAPREAGVFLSALLLLMLMTGCSGSGGSGSVGGVFSSTTGSATARLVWQELPRSSIYKAAAAPGVATVRVIISGSGISPDIQQDYAAGDGSGTIGGIPVGTNRTFTFQGLDAGSNVTHQGVVNNVTITSGQTIDLGTVTMLVSVAPAAPTGLKATAITSKRIDLSWTDSDSFETGFTIERKTGAGGTWAQVATVAANAVSYSNTGLDPATAYYYRVKATNGAGDSDWSGEANALTAAIDLPKTGQTTSYAGGDDGDLEKGAARPSPRFTDNSDGTVTDNLTGLVWLKDANCYETVGGVANGESLVWADALTWSNNLQQGNCGLIDGSTAGNWRLPNIMELESLLDAEKYNLSLPAGHPFSNVVYSEYWSSSSMASNSNGAWYINMDNGSVSVYAKSLYGWVWPVRAVSSTLPKTGQTTSYATGDNGNLGTGVAWPTTRFIDNGNGTVTDNLTGLIWLKNANCTTTVGGIAKGSGYLTWANALTWSNNLKHGNCGLSDNSTAGQWRLPNRKELQSLIDWSSSSPALPAGHLFSNVLSNTYWSSSSYAGATTDAWSVIMSNGTAGRYGKTNNWYVWPVRGGQ